MECLNPVTIKVKVSKFEKEFNDYGYKEVQIPCGKCPACLKRRQRDWSVRLYVENYYSRASFFVTLTYDNEHLPENGVCKKHVQDFFKRVRKVRPFRYFLVSEYGDKFHRPHYHLLAFFPEDVSTVDVWRLFYDKWPYGNIKIGTVTLKSINYCAKYCLKPKCEESQGQNRVFTLCSRRPGIGGALCEDAALRSVVHEAGDFRLHGFGRFSRSLPRYYRDRIYTEEERSRYAREVQETFAVRPELSGYERYIRRQVEDQKLIDKYGERVTPKKEFNYIKWNGMILPW